ncbi:MAG: AAA family ATPase [Pirellulaceae bacterium]
MNTKGQRSPLDFALEYVGAGLSILPVSTDGTKAPDKRLLPRVQKEADRFSATWLPLQERLPTDDELRKWYGPAGIGVIGGKVSGNLEILDIDDGEIVGPYKAAVEAEAPGLLDRLPQSQTPRDGGGLHIFYRLTIEPPGNSKLAMSDSRPQFNSDGEPDIDLRTGEQRLAPETLIETRGEGGYVVAPGSPGICHATGREYRHVGGPPITDTPIISAVEREILHSAARSFNRHVDQKPAGEANGKPRDGLAPGDGYNQQATTETILDLLSSAGWTVCGGAGDVIRVRRPGKSCGISGTVGLVSKAGNVLFCCFSSNAHPFDGAGEGRSCSTDSAFSVFAKLHHGGDFKEAAKDLAAKGYGEIQRHFDEPPADIDLEAEPGWDDHTATFRRDVVPTGEEPKPNCEIVSARALMAEHTRLREPVVDGLLRRGEVMNVIAAAKRGKSWLNYGLALSVVTGDVWLDKFQCRKGRVLLIDNELHPETLASRINTVANAFFIKAEEYGNDLDVLSLRGRLLDLNGISRALRDVAPLTYDVVILDAFYRALTPGVSENDNAGMAALYNRIDQVVAALDCCWINIHHASKGEQGQKSVVDVGAGAGSQSRAADTHLILRDHEEPNVVVLEAAVRSFAPIEPLALRWTFPLWEPTSGVDTDKLKGRQTKADQRQAKLDAEGFEIIRNYLKANGAATASKVVMNTSLGRERAKRLLNVLHERGELDAQEINARGNETREFSLRGPSPPTT